MTAAWLRLLLSLGLLRCESCHKRARWLVQAPKGTLRMCDDCALEVKDILEEVLTNLGPDGRATISAYSKRVPQ